MGGTVRSAPSAAVGLLAAVALLVAGCTPGDADPQVVSLADLVADHDAYDGTTVIAEGIVQSFDDPPHSWIEDVEQHRVELFPHEQVEDLVGLRVRVTGEFTFEEDRGRGIDIDELEVLDEPPAAAPWLDRTRPGEGVPRWSAIVSARR